MLDFSRSRGAQLAPVSIGEKSNMSLFFGGLEGFVDDEEVGQQRA